MLFANLSTSFHSFVAESRFRNEIVRWIQLYTLFGMPSVEHAHYNAAANIASYRSEYWRRNRMWFCYFGQINRNAIMRHNIHTVLYANPSNRPKAAAPVVVTFCLLLSIHIVIVVVTIAAVVVLVWWIPFSPCAGITIGQCHRQNNP